MNKADTMAQCLAVPARMLVVAILAALFFLTGCDPLPEEDEGGVVGTGIILRGTASENRAFASNTVDIKAKSGEASSGVIDELGRYRVAAGTGMGPWVLRTDLGNGQYRYGIAFSEQIANIHSYSDVVLRNWFARNDNPDIDDTFASNGALPALPTLIQFHQASAGLFKVVDLVLASYNVTGDQLLFDSFDADNTGIDLYLNSNPTIVDGNFISILLTDPSNQTQSISRSVLSLDVDFTGPDSEPPEAPGSVRALGSASNEMVIVWEPAEDNVGIARYEIYRDDQLLQITPYPVYTDSNLRTGTSYHYEVVAVDAAGNSSERSAVAVGYTLGEPDIQPPPAPTTLTLIQSRSNCVDLIWGQADIGDVVRFNIYRGPRTDSLQLLLQVTSTFTTDVTVSGDATYCYQVSAEDASGNKSIRSDVLCVDTSGESSEQPLSGSDTVPPLAGLSVPDTFLILCESTLSVSEITQNTTLSDPCYQVQQGVEVAQYVNLTISAGTVLKFAGGASDTNLGGENSGAIQLACSADISARLAISDSDIVSSGGWGIYLNEPGCVLDIGQEIRFINNASGDVNFR